MALKHLYIALTIAAIFFFAMFSVWTKSLIPFWPTMTLTALTLTCLSLLWGGWQKSWIRIDLPSIIVGIGSALFLWGVFYIGNQLSGWLLDFARPQIDLIYSIKSGEDHIKIGLLLLLLIGPAEEIFWRGYIQRTLSKTWGANIGFGVATAMYTLVHIWSFNLMLVGAAAVAGLFWGLMFRLRPANLFPLILSHALWDLLVFIVFPL